MAEQVIPTNQIRMPEDKSGAMGTVFVKLEDAVR